MGQLPRLGKRELICLLLFTCNYVVSVWRGFLFLWVLGMGYVILLWHPLSLPYNYIIISKFNVFFFFFFLGGGGGELDESTFFLLCLISGDSAVSNLAPQINDPMNISIYKVNDLT